MRKPVMPKRKKDPTFGEDMIAATNEAAAYLRGEVELTTVEVVPEHVDVAALRKRLDMSQAEFSATFGFAKSAIRDWEQKRRQPERSARVLLKVIEKNPKAVFDALHA